MSKNRRDFIKSAGQLAFIGTMVNRTELVVQSDVSYSVLDGIREKPVLLKSLFSDPVRIETIDLLRYQQSFLCRVRSTDGTEGWSICNNIRTVFLYPIQIQRVHPFFIGKDARDLDRLLKEVYVYQSNYKFQSYALWVPVATVEFAILDMLGKIAGKSMAELFGPRYADEVAVYYAPNFRHKDVDESLDLALAEAKRGGYEAIKFKIGKKMGEDREDVPGRTEKLIPAARKRFGEKFWLGVDANGGYSVKNAVGIGKILDANRYDFYEEPVPFDWYEETRQVAKKVKTPLAGGEQESSMHAFRWMIKNKAIQIVRVDPFYFGGMIRSLKVARMAEAAGLRVVPHLSGSGLGFLYAHQFVSMLPNAGKFHANGRDQNPTPIQCDTSTLQVEQGKITIPRGPGLGIDIDPDFIRKHKPLTE